MAIDKKINRSGSNNPEVQTPRQYQPTSKVGRNYIFGYSKCIRNTNKSVMDLFSDITIIHEETIYPVPIIWGTQEKAVIYAFGEQFAANPDRKETGLVDRIRLPMIALTGGDIGLAEDRYIYHQARRRGGTSGKGFYGQEKRPYDVVYRFSKGIPVDMSFTLTLWAKYYEHLMQMVEQIFQKFSPIAYIKAEGIPWETPVKITGSSNNVNEDIGDRQVRILKYAFNLTAESHVTQPTRRDKTALKVTQKYVLMGDLVPDNEVETLVDEVEEGETP